MSKERQRARAAREAARREEVEAAARRRDRETRRQARVARLTPALPRRRRRYGALPTVVLVRLLVVYAVVQVLAWLLLSDVGASLAVAALSAGLLLIVANTRRSYR